MSAFRHRLIVHRDSRDEATFAVLEWNGVHPSMLLGALRSALAEWRHTPEGHAAWEESCHDFNIGDLANAPHERGALADMLSRHGVQHLQIDVYSCDDRMPWSFDTHLMEDLENEAGTA